MGSESRIHDDDTDGEGPKAKLRIATEMDKIGMGLAQIEIMLLSGGVFMVEGCLLVIASVIVRTLEVRWDNSLYHTMLLAVAMFVGVSFGCMAGLLASRCCLQLRISQKSDALFSRRSLDRSFLERKSSKRNYWCYHRYSFEMILPPRRIRNMI